MFRGKKTEQASRRRPTEQRGKAKTFSYYGNSAGERREKAAEKTIDLGSQRRLRLLPTFIATAVIVGSLLFSFTLSTSPAVNMLEGQQAVYRPLEEYAVAAEKLLSSRLGNRTKLTVDSKAIEDELMKNYPELGAVALRLPVLGRKPNLVVDITPPAMLLVTNSKVYVIDRSGTVVSEASNLPDETKQGLLVLRDNSGLDVSVGGQAVTSKTVDFVMAAKAQLDAKTLKITELTLPAAASELDIRLEGLSYFIKTDTTGDARLQMGSFLAAKDSGVKPSEYIDVRVEEKVFYR